MLILNLLSQILAGVLGIASALAKLTVSIGLRFDKVDKKLVDMDAKLDESLVLLKELQALVPGPAVKIVFNATIKGEPTQEGVTMLQLTDVQQVSLTIQPVDAKGNPAPVDGVPAWNVSDATVLDLQVAADGLSAVVTAKGPLTPAGGSVQVSVSADADLTSGVTTINGSLDIAVVASQATTVGIVAGTPSTAGAAPAPQAAAPAAKS